MHKWFQVFLMADGGDGAGGAGDASGAGADTGVTGQDAAGQGEGAENAPAESPTVPDAKARKAAYEKLIRGEYKDLDDARVQRIVQSRLKDGNAAKETLNKLDAPLRLLQKHYGVENLDALAQAITGDDRYYEEEAQKRGMDTEHYKLFAQQEAQLQAYREAEQQARQQQEKTQQVIHWREEEAALKQQYPDFDLDAEMEASDGELFRMLDRGISLEHAYKVLHMDDIMMGTIAGAVQRTAQRVTDSIRANGMRPEENGAGKSPARQVGVPVSKLTKAQMDALERRAARGETITPDKFG